MAVSKCGNASTPAAQRTGTCKRLRTRWHGRGFGADLAAFAADSSSQGRQNSARALRQMVVPDSGLHRRYLLSGWVIDPGSGGAVVAALQGPVAGIVGMRGPRTGE